ncbi:efflux RND transporter permease subunit [Geomesophilobacter sediminis]|uniref:Efflux RND transporter permease subunit n=1 Tax=Geomesophilobacter sediminis TaxID=2798584 RepID=A0A8J7J011_9BACT|nr:efflux RND transporter permease subunit [Geomesophilobacter sediminis]MBJ6725792.1 efflux RND transporter permease subunit [Geomesophilobacter sediminis]
MSRFAIRNPYFIVVVCLIVLVVGANSLNRMPVDMFPSMNIPVVVVATFYSGMAPEQIETDITSSFERFFTLASGVEHIESRSLAGVSVIKVYFQPGSNPDSAVTSISNLAMAQLRRLPPGTLPPVVLKFDASSLPVCLVTLKGEGLNETALRDLAQFQVRNQIAGVPGASVPPPFGGKYRQIMVYTDPHQLEAHQLSPMDVVRSINESNLILPSGDAQIGPLDYNIYANSQLDTMDQIQNLPIKMVGQAPVRVGDVARVEDGHQIQTNVVRVDGQRSVYLPVMKQGGDTNTIAVVDGIKSALTRLFDVPRNLVSKVVFDQSEFVKTAIETLIHEGTLGLILTSVMILVFLGSMRATVAVFFSIPLSALATFIALQMGGGSINSMVLGGLALVFSRLIDNSVVVLENIYRHLEEGESPEEAAENGGREVALPVLAATLTTAVVFFPVTFLYGVSKFLFSALALAVVLALVASYVVALTVVPLFCARFIKAPSHHGTPSTEIPVMVEVKEQHETWGERFNIWFNDRFESFLKGYDRMVGVALRRPWAVLGGFAALFALSLALFPLMGLSFFPRTDAGQFVINLKAPSGTRLTLTEEEVAKVEALIRKEVAPEELGMIVSNIGAAADFSAIYTPNSTVHTAFVQVSLKPEHKTSSFEYMDRIKKKIGTELPELTSYFQSGSLTDAVLNMGMPAPIDVQVAGSNQADAFKTAQQLAAKIRQLPNVADVYVPQDLDYPALRMDVDRTRASQLGLNQREVVDNVITALTSNSMISPSFWMDPKTGNDYMLTVQYPENEIKSIADLSAIPLKAPGSAESTRLDMISSLTRTTSPTEVDHYQLRRTIDIYVRTQHEDLGRVAGAIDGIIAQTRIPHGLNVALRGSVQGMRASFQSFAGGLALALLLVYLILVAQFRSFVDPFIILIAVPPAVTGVIATLLLSGTTLNVMSLMGVVMLVGIAVSNSILIVEFIRHLREQGTELGEAVVVACRVRLRPVLMTSLATIIGLLPMALKLGAGSEAYAPLARAILGGLTASVALTVFLVPVAYLVIHRPRTATVAAPEPEVSQHA